MNRYSTALALSIIATAGTLMFQHNNALARVVDGSGHAISEIGHRVSGLDDWTVRPNAADAATKELPVFADMVAAHIRATELVNCIQLENAKHEAEFRLTWTTNNMSLRDVERHERLLAGLKKTIASLYATHACAGITVEEAREEVYPTLLAAAKYGDTSAAACYASAITPLPEDQNSEENIRAFRANATAFVQAGIARGDWRSVEIMTQATGKLGYRHDWFGHLEPPSREQGYRYRKLMRLAATGNLAGDLDDELASLARHMSPEAVREMDAQAQEDYAAHFANSPMLDERAISCEMSEFTR